tara:strand:- start:1002 stop:1439 length:438 start_codon:yes stop_codon:yes gene_type:complete
MKLIKDFNFRKILSLFLQQNGSPIFNAKGLAFGVFSGCFPLFGLQTLIGVFLAQIGRGNIVLAAIGTWISNPFTYLPLYFFNYKLGALLLPKSKNIILDPVLIKEDFWGQGWFFTSRLVLGSSLVGLFLGITFGFIAYIFYKRKF